MRHAKRASWWLTRLLPLVGLAATGAEARAQTPREVPADLAAALKPGTIVWITERGGREERTRIVEMSGDEIVTTAAAETRRFRTAEIARIQVRRADAVIDGALIGAAAGVASGLFVCRATEPWANCLDDVGPMLAFAAVGASIGIAADALIRGRQTIYDGPPGVTRLRLLPVPAPGGAGLSVSLSF